MQLILCCSYNPPHVKVAAALLGLRRSTQYVTYALYSEERLTLMQQLQTDRCSQIKTPTLCTFLFLGSENERSPYQMCYTPLEHPRP